METSGIINFLKPPGMTSFDAVSYVRNRLKIKKAGHTGTLDPDASGVLVICLGKATRLVEYYTSDEKEYTTELILGISTKTQDTSGEILNINQVNYADIEKRIAPVINSYIGEIEQIPPMYSAIKINGERLYSLARKGIEIERKPRKISIYDLKINDISQKTINIEDQENIHVVSVILSIKCSKGTYIRTLCNDIGESLGCDGCMGLLVRTKAGIFDIKDSISPLELEENIKNIDADKMLLPVDLGLSKIEAIHLNEVDSKKFQLGTKLSYKNIEEKEYKVYNETNVFIGIAKGIIGEEYNILKPHKVFK